MQGDEASRANTLDALGWDAHWIQEHTAAAADLVPARVTAAHGERFFALDAAGQREAVDRTPAHDVCVGDWVLLPEAPRDVLCRAEHVLPRRTALHRQSAGGRSAGQLLAANVDIAFLVSGADNDFNPRRIERYLTLVYEGGVTPVIVVNKADLLDDPAGILAEVEAIAFGVDVILTSTATGTGLDALRARIGDRMTCVFLGSSGVGKSSLANALLGEAQQATGAVRTADQRGRHTTTGRTLLPLPDGGVIIDTPGLREVMPWGGGEELGRTFPEVNELAGQCHFSDCSHTQEPGCAVLAAAAQGTLDPARLDAFHKQQRELAYQDRRRDYFAQQDEKRRWKQISKEVKRHYKQKR